MVKLMHALFALLAPGLSALSCHRCPSRCLAPIDWPRAHCLQKFGLPRLDFRHAQQSMQGDLTAHRHHSHAACRPARHMLLHSEPEAESSRVVSMTLHVQCNNAVGLVQHNTSITPTSQSARAQSQISQQTNSLPYCPFAT